MADNDLIFAISGGVDSCYLLHTLVSQGLKGVVCHVNHGLRVESAGDARFVQELAQSYGLPYEEKTLELIIEAGFEARARHERLQFFSKVAKSYGIQRVALAHHADDQAETLLMQLCRGTQELPGIREFTEMEEYGLELWRPLLSVRKAEIVNWMREREYSWCEDHTNAESITTRNRVRLEVIPLLNEIFSRDVTPVINRARGATLVNQIDELMLLINFQDPQGRLYLPALEGLSLKLQQRVLYRYLKEQGVSELSASKMEECHTLMTNPDIWKINLAEGRFLRRKEKRIFLG